MRIASFLILLSACASAPKPPPCQDPPAHRYAIAADVASMLDDGNAAYAAFASAFRRDLEADLRAHPCNVEAVKDHMFDLALLDALDGRWDDAVARLDAIEPLETQPGMKAMRGFTIRVWAEAHGDANGYRAALAHQLGLLPYDLVHDALGVLRQLGEALTPDASRQGLTEFVGKDAAAGSVALDKAEAILFQRYAIRYIAPVGPVTVEEVTKIMQAHGG